MDGVTLSESDGRNRPTPPALATALANEVEAAGLFPCSQCGKRVPDHDFVRYINDFSYIRKKSDQPDPARLLEHGDGECWRCFDEAGVSNYNGKCVRCRRPWGGHPHCPNCRGRVQ